MTQPTAAPLDDWTARWCETAEQRAMFEVIRASAERDPAPGGARVGLAGGSLPLVALTTLDMAFFNRIVGLGVEQPATETLLDEALAFYADLGQEQVAISLAPHAGPPALTTWLEARGFSPSSRWAKCWRTVDAIPDVATELRIERIGPAAADDFDTIIMEAFDMPPGVAGVAAGIVGQDGWSVYLGYDGERPVSCAAMQVADGVAWFGFGATVEAARGRGGQSAMFARRLHDARDLGCAVAVTETGEDTPDEPNPSFRNMIRLGFQLAYLRPNWRRA